MNNSSNSSNEFIKAHRDFFHKAILDIKWLPETNRIPFKRCSHCFSISPLDMLEYARRSSTYVKSVEYKYGWPHKFVIGGILNNSSGEEVDTAWFNVHFRDCSTDEVFDELAAFFLRKAKIKFGKNIQGVMWTDLTKTGDE